jgi:hypothetical protein
MNQARSDGWNVQTCLLAVPSEQNYFHPFFPCFFHANSNNKIIKKHCDGENENIYFERDTSMLRLFAFWCLQSHSIKNQTQETKKWSNLRNCTNDYNKTRDYVEKNTIRINFNNQLNCITCRIFSCSTFS